MTKQLYCEARILCSFLLQLNVESSPDIPVKKLNPKVVCFLFKLVWLKVMVTKQKLRTKFVNFVVKLCNINLLIILKSMFNLF